MNPYRYGAKSDIREVGLKRLYCHFSTLHYVLESQMIAESLKGRVKFNCAADDNTNRGSIYDLVIDGGLVKRFSFLTLSDYFARIGCSKNTKIYTEALGEIGDKLDKFGIDRRTEYSDDEFEAAFAEYTESFALDCLTSHNPILRLFAILDKRITPFYLVRNVREIAKQPLWLKRVYLVRYEAEGITLTFKDGEYAVAENAKNKLYMQTFVGKSLL